MHTNFKEQLAEREVRLKLAYNQEKFSKAKMHYEELLALDFNALDMDYAEDSQAFVKKLYDSGRLIILLPLVKNSVIKLADLHKTLVGNILELLDKIAVEDKPGFIPYFDEKLRIFTEDIDHFFNPEESYFLHFNKYNYLQDKLAQIKLLAVHTAKLLLNHIELRNPDLDEKAKHALKLHFCQLEKKDIEHDILGILAKLLQLEANPFIQQFHQKFPAFKNVHALSIPTAVLDKARTELGQFLQDRIAELKNGITNAPLIDLVHQLLILFARLNPINTEDYISCLEITPFDSVVNSAGSQFDIVELLNYHRGRDHRSFMDESVSMKKLLNPLSNLPFSALDTIYIIARAHEKNLRTDYLHLKDIPLFDLCLNCPDQAKYILKTPVLFSHLLSQVPLRPHLVLEKLAKSDVRTADFIIHNPALFNILALKPHAIMGILATAGKQSTQLACTILGNPVYKKFCPPLHFSIKCENETLIAQYLHDNLEKDTPYGTPLYLAAFMGNLKIVQLLLEHGANCDKASTLGTALYAAAKKGHLEIVKFLISLGANPATISKKSGLTPLLASIRNKRSGVIDYLLSLGVPLDHAEVSREMYYGVLLSNGYEKTLIEGLDTLKDLTKELVFLIPAVTKYSGVKTIKYLIERNITVNPHFSTLCEEAIREAILNDNGEMLKLMVLLSDNPTYTINKALSFYDKESCSDETISILKTINLIFKAVDELNRPIHDMARMNYKNILFSALKCHQDITLSLLAKLIEKPDFPGKFLFYMKQAAKELSLTDEILKIEQESIKKRSSNDEISTKLFGFFAGREQSKEAAQIHWDQSLNPDYGSPRIEG